MSTVTQVSQALLGAALLLQAAIAAFPPRRFPRLANASPRGNVARIALAAISALAGIATWFGLAVPFAAFFASCLALAAAGLSELAVLRSKSRGAWTAPAMIGAAAVVVAAGQPLGLKVLALPKADALPYRPAEARVVKTYDEGVWFEGIAAGAGGMLYLASNRGLDFSRADYWHDAEGTVIARDASGDERVLFRLPRGSAAGVIAVGPDETLYLTSNGASPGIFRITKEGRGEALARLPEGAWPNGIDFGPDGYLYSADSRLGAVWRIDPRTGESSKAIEDDRLRARAYIALAPGANGLHFRGRSLIVTVSDRTTVLDYPMQPDGRFGEPTVIASGIPGDDFAIGRDGSLFVTTHPYDTLVKVSPSGERVVVADKRQHIVGATDAVFGSGAADRDTLYVVTDGGAFTGGPRTRGELVALKVVAS